MSQYLDALEAELRGSGLGIGQAAQELLLYARKLEMEPINDDLSLRAAAASWVILCDRVATSSSTGTTLNHALQVEMHNIEVSQRQAIIRTEHAGEPS